MQLIKNNSYLLIIVLLCVTFTMIGINKLEQEIAYQHVTVSEGDTLWGYSIEFADNVPTDKWIEEIIKLNELSSTEIQIGKELRIPIKTLQFDKNEIASNTTGDRK